jgi:SRSO17 transposase
MALYKAGAEPLPELAEFLTPFGALVSRAESKRALERYATGLLSDLPRKTLARMGQAVAGTHDQRLQEFLTRTAWDAREMDRLRIRRMLVDATSGQGVLIVDDTGIAKKGQHSVGVARQYSGTLGRVDNCQVLVTAHYVDRVFDWPIMARLYLTESWANDSARCREARVPEDTEFQTKGEIALGLIDEARQAGVTPRAVVMDCGYGDQPPLLDGLEARKMAYAASVGVAVRFRLGEAVQADTGDPPVPARRPRGRPRMKPGLEARVPALAAQAILATLPPEAWTQVAWRQGTKGPLVKQCARVRVYRAGQRGKHLPSSGWLIGERPAPGHAGGPKQYFLWGLDDLPLHEQVELAHLRWVIERFYQDAKGELGLDHYEGRLWHGLHRHLALVMLAHCFLTLQQSYGPAVLDPNPAARGFPPGGAEKPGRAQAPRARGSLSTSHLVPRQQSRRTELTE